MKRWMANVVGLALLMAVGLGVIAAEPRSAQKSGIDKTFVDSKVRPQDDLFRHVNGKWLAESPIPADRSLDGAFYKLRDQSEASLRPIIEEAASSGGSGSAEGKKVGDLFASFMDEEKINKLGLSPIQADLDLIKAVTDKPGLIRAFAKLGKEGADVPFGMSVDTDAKKSDRYILYIAQGGLGLPDESYYRARQVRRRSARPIIGAHPKTMFELAKMPGPGPRLAEFQVMALETRLARDQLGSGQEPRRHPDLQQEDPVKELAELTPGFDWDLWFKTSSAPRGSTRSSSVQPSYLDRDGQGHRMRSRWSTWKTVARPGASLRHNAPYAEQAVRQREFQPSTARP